MLKTNKIFLDTSFFRSQNYLTGTYVKSLSELASKKIITFYITEIVYREVLNNFKKDAEKFTEPIRKGNLKALKNLDRVRGEVEKLENIDLDALQLEFTANFDKWIKDHYVVVIPVNRVDIDKIFDNYFENRPPFAKTGNKKSEFPDAFSLEALKKIIKKDKAKIYVVSEDADLKIKNDHFIHIKDKEVSTLIDHIIRKYFEYHKQEVLKLIDGGLEDQKADILWHVKEQIINLILKDFPGRISGVDFDFKPDIEIKSANFNSYAITYINPDIRVVEVEMEIIFFYHIYAQGMDYSESYYDREDDQWLFIEPVVINEDDSYAAKVFLNGDYDIEQSKIQFQIYSVGQETGPIFFLPDSEDFDDPNEPFI